MEFFKTIWEALGFRRATILGSVAGIVRIGDWGIGQLTEAHTVSSYLGLPIWVLPPFALLALLAFYVATYATKLRLEAIPEFTFKLADQVERVPVGRGEKMAIRGIATGISGDNKCKAFIRSVRRFDAGQSRHTDVPVRSRVELHWPDTKKGLMAKADTEVRIAPNEHFTFDILESHSSDSRLRVPGDGDCAAWVQKLFEVPGDYEVGVCVSAGEKTLECLIDVSWSGQWDSLTFNEKKCGAQHISIWKRLLSPASWFDSPWSIGWKKAPKRLGSS